MKSLALVVSTIWLWAGIASANSVVAHGKILYKGKDNVLSQVPVSLELPAQGKGEVVLNFLNADAEVVKSIRTEVFKSQRLERVGRIVFSVLFKTEDENGVVYGLAMQGTYLRGSNLAVYYGDVYGFLKGEEPKLTDDFATLDKVTHAGGFYVKAEVPGSSE